ncbi:unnamed protein product [Pleuronectes platessa]|uniref:Uncharacterized protein n=1 Tax=Pleuronectes platessa TaxID=8262 RepID=A0A9N7YGQ9_PLEPL|nr:unnamed protein product [Pleuronectes platessa]
MASELEARNERSEREGGGKILTEEGIKTATSGEKADEAKGPDRLDVCTPFYEPAAIKGACHLSCGARLQRRTLNTLNALYERPQIKKDLGPSLQWHKHSHGRDAPAHVHVHALVSSH